MWGPVALWHLWVAWKTADDSTFLRYRQSRGTCLISIIELYLFYPARMICYNIVILPASFYMHNWCHMWYMTSYFRITERLTFPHRFIDMATSLEQNRFFPNKTPISKSAYPKKWKCIQKPWGPCKINKKNDTYYNLHLLICVCILYI